MGPPIPLYEKLACACGDKPRADCFEEDLVLGEASKVAFGGEPNKVVTKDATFVVETDGADFAVQIGKVPFAQFNRGTGAITTSGRKLQDACTQRSNGQLMGPGLKVSAKDGGKFNYVYMCVTKDPSQTACEKFPNAKFARSLTSDSIGVTEDVEVTIKDNGATYCANFTSAGTFFPVQVDKPITAGPTVAPTDATTKTPVPTKQPTTTPTNVGATASPTQHPTFAPTPKPTNPKKPTYNAADFDLSTYKVVTNIADITLPATGAPTKSPTFKGYKMVKKMVKKQAAKVEFTFPIPSGDANLPSMRDTLTTGLANTMGLEPKSVSITKINGVAVRRLLLLSDRRLAGQSTKIEFQIISNSDDASAVAQLKKDLETAATEGSLVANIQKVASDNGVLVQALKDMQRELTKPVVSTVEVEVEVLVQERTTDAPTKQPTTTPTNAPTTQPSTKPTTRPTKAPVLNGASGKFGSHSMQILSACSVLLMTWFARQE
jgi:hypothetical protein